MKSKSCLLHLLLFILSISLLKAQSRDSTYHWEDQLLLDENPYPVIARLARSPAPNKLAYLNRLAEAHLLSLEFSEAGEILKKAQLISGPGSSFERAYLHLNWSRYYYEQSNYTESEKEARTALLLMTPFPSGPLLHLSTLQLGKTYLQMKKMNNSKSQLDEALQYFKKDSLLYPIKLAQTCFGLGLWYKINGQFEKSITYYKESIDLLESSGTPHFYDLGKCLNNLGGAYNELGDYKNAQFYFLKALDIKKKYITDSMSIAITYNNLGRFYYEFGNYLKSRDCFDKSISLLDEGNPRHREKIPEFLNNYSALLLNLDEPDLAEKYLGKSIRLLESEDVNSIKLVSPFLSLSGLMKLREDFKETESFIQKAEHILEEQKVPDSSFASSFYHARADLYLQQGRLDEAEVQIKKAIAASQRNTTAEALYYQLYGQIKLKQNSNSEALQLFFKSNQITEENSSTTNPVHCASLNMLGETYRQMGKPDSAILYFQNSININLLNSSTDKSANTAAANPFELIATCYFLSVIYEEKYSSSKNPKDLDRSREYIDLGLRAIDGRRKALSTTNDQLMFNVRVVEFFERAMEVYYLIGELNQSTGDLEKAFYISELSKFQSLGQSLRKSNLNTFSDVPRVLQSKEQYLRTKVQALDNQLLKELQLGQDANQDLIQEYNKDLLTATTSYQILQDSIRQNLPGYFQLKYDKTLITSNEIQRDLLQKDPHVALLEFTFGDSVSFCHIITAHDQKLIRITNTQQTKNRIIAIRNQIKLGMTTELYENARWLFTNLLEPVETYFKDHKMGIHRLIIVPDQVLCYLPFEALMRENSGTRFLVSDYDISYAYSSTLLWQKATEKPSGSASFIGLAPEFTAKGNVNSVRTTRDREFQFQPLPGNRAEVEQINSGLHKNKITGRILEGADATEDSFRKLDLKQYSIIHFATHGFVDMDNPQFSGVAFSQNIGGQPFDDILFTNEVYELHLAAQLVCISSCESGLGKLYQGEGMVGLARAFLYAGARNLAVSLWKVDDTATRDLMISFYSQINNKSFSTSLAQAKRKMAASKQYSHPYFWASFVLIGQ